MSSTDQEKLPPKYGNESDIPPSKREQKMENGSQPADANIGSQNNKKSPMLKRPITETSFSKSQTLTSSLNDSIDFSSPQTWGDFEVQQVLGKGAMGTVYKGRQVSLDRTIALKVLPASLASDENFLKRFELEAKAVAKISSPHVVQVYAAGNHEGQEYFAMEYVEGMDLAAKLEAGYKPSFNEALDIVQQVARGLAAAAELNIIHRDIKPSNIMVTEKGLMKIMDFGLVKLTGSQTASLTMAGTLLGTVNYLSPEQGRGEDCDKRSDLYSLGVMLYELLTGRLPFAGDNPGSIIYQHNFVEPVLPMEINPKIPKYHQAIVLKCMQKKPDDRYQDPLELITDIDLIKKWKPPATAKTYVNPSVLLADESLTKSSDFLSDKAEEPEDEKSEEILTESKKAKKIAQPLIITAIVILAIAGILGLYKLNSTDHGLVSIKQAQQLLSDGKYLQCRDIVDANLAITPNDSGWDKLKQELDAQESENLLGIAQLQFERNKFSATRASALRVLQFFPENNKAKKLIRRLDERQRDLKNAQLFLNEGKFTECRSLVKKNIEAFPKDLDWLKIYTKLNREEGSSLLRIAKAQFYVGDYETIHSHLIRVIDLLSNNEQAEMLLEKLDKRHHAFKLARELLLEEQFSQCRNVIEHNINEDPNDPGWIALRSELNTKEGENLLRKTKLEVEQNNHEAARKHIARTLELIPDNVEAKQLYSALIERNKDFSLVQQLLDAGNFQQCHEIINKHLSVSPTDNDWLRLRITLKAKEGKSLLASTQYDMDNYDYESANKKLEKLLNLMPENAKVLEIKDKIEKRSSALKKTQQLIEQKEFSEGRRFVEKYLNISPRDPGWLATLNELNSKEVQHKILLGKFAYSRGEIDAAQKIAKRVLELMPDNNDAQELLRQIGQLEKVEKSQKTIEPVEDYERKSMAEEKEPISQSHRKTAGIKTYPFENERNIIARVNLLKRMLNDKDQELVMIEEAIEDFIGDVGEGHGEVGELKRGLQDRRDEESIKDILATLDKAVMSQNSKQLGDIVKVKEHVEALSSLMGQPGLIFQHHLHSFKRSGDDKVILKVILNHALLYMPPTDIYYRYEVQRKGYLWIITSVQMLERLN